MRAQLEKVYPTQVPMKSHVALVTGGPETCCESCEQLLPFLNGWGCYYLSHLNFDPTITQDTNMVHILINTNNMRFYS